MKIRIQRVGVQNGLRIKSAMTRLTYTAHAAMERLFSKFLSRSIDDTAISLLSRRLLRFARKDTIEIMCLY